MGMAIEDLLRLAWRADGDGKPGLRDALLTLAVVDSGTENAVLAERCRRLLIARRPEHWFATSPTLGQALAHTKVANAVERLRLTFPPVRVERLLVRYSVLGGPYTGRTASLAQVLDDLSLTPDSKTASARRQAVSRSARASTITLSGASVSGLADGPDPDGSLAALYFSLLFAMAVLLNTVLEPAARENSKAA